MPEMNGSYRGCDRRPCAVKQVFGFNCTNSCTVTASHDFPIDGLDTHISPHRRGRPGSARLDRRIAGHQWGGRSVGTVAEAVEAVARYRPVWGLVDFQLSDNDGLDFLNAVCALAIEDYRLKVITVTGWDSKIGRVGEFVGGTDHYLLEPVNWDHLLQRVRPSKVVAHVELQRDSQYCYLT